MKNIVSSLILYTVIVVLSYYYAFRKDKSKAKKSLSKGWKQFLDRLPLLFAIFLLIGLFDVFVPKEVVVKFIGAGRGIVSIFSAAVLGSVIMGPVSSAYPLGGVLLKKGATVATTAVFLNAWVMVGVVTFPFEVSVFGKKFALTRNVLAFIGAIVVGVLTGFILTGRFL